MKLLYKTFLLITLFSAISKLCDAQFSKQSYSLTPLDFLIKAQGGGFYGLSDTADVINIIRFDESMSVIWSKKLIYASMKGVNFFRQDNNSRLLFGGRYNTYYDGFLTELDSNANILYSVSLGNRLVVKSASFSPQNELYIVTYHDTSFSKIRVVLKLDTNKNIVWTNKKNFVMYSDNPSSSIFFNNTLYILSNNPDGTDSKMRLESFDSSGSWINDTEWAFEAPGIPDPELIQMNSGKFLISGTALPINVYFNPVCNILCMMNGVGLVRQRALFFSGAPNQYALTDFKSCVTPNESIISAGEIGDSILIFMSDVNLDIQWKYIIDDNNNSKVKSIAATSDNGCVLLLNRGGNSAFIKFDSLGHSVCPQLPYSGDSIVQMPAPLFLGGAFLVNSSTTLTPLLLIDTVYSYSLTNYCFPTFSSNQINQNGFSIYPNPTSGILNINLDEIREYEIEILNADGKVLFMKRIFADKYQIDLKDFPSSVYVIQVKSQENVFRKMVVKR